MNLFTHVINQAFITLKTKCIWSEQYNNLHIQMQCVSKQLGDIPHTHFFNNPLTVNTNANATNFCFKVSNISLLLHFHCILNYTQKQDIKNYFIFQFAYFFSICIFHIIILLHKASKAHKAKTR